MAIWWLALLLPLVSGHQHVLKGDHGEIGTPGQQGLPGPIGPPGRPGSDGVPVMTAKGPCVFPFTWEGISYNECTLHKANYGKPWCGLVSNMDVDYRWANCIDGGKTSSSCKSNADWVQTPDMGIRGHDNKIITSASVTDCENACSSETSFTCLSTDYDTAGRKCYLSTNTKYNVGSYWQYYIGWVHSERKSNIGTSYVGWTQTPDMGIRGHDNKIIKCASTEDCQIACGGETSFYCLSIDYYTAHKTCSLSTATKYTVGSAWRSYPGCVHSERQQDKCTVLTAKGPCVFPFVWEGITFTACTLYKANYGKPWCGLVPNMDTDYKWANCKDGGKLPDGCAATRKTDVVRNAGQQRVLKGDRGEIGTPGQQGLPGPIGPPGRPGSDGVPGLTGADGSKGVAGGVGKPGLKGDLGDKGAGGDTGIPGEPGREGKPGPNGLPGLSGGKGVRGPVGLPGARGLAGPKGPNGEPCECQGNRKVVAFSGSAQNVGKPSDTAAPVRISKTFTDLGDFYSTKTSSFRVPVDGKYFFSVVTIADGSTSVPIILEQSDQEVLATDASRDKVGSIGVSRVLLNLSEGDTLNLRVRAKKAGFWNGLLNNGHSKTDVTVVAYLVQ